MIDYVNIRDCITKGEFADSGTKGYNIVPCESYPPLIIWVGKIFSAREIFFKQFLLFLFAFIAPLILYKATGQPIAAWFYFSTTSFFFAVITGAFYAQALSVLLLMAMLFVRTELRIVLLALSILAHSSSFPIAIAFFFLLELENFGKLKGFLICSPFWNKVPDALTGDIIPQNSYSHLTINVILSYLIKRTPLVFLIPSVWQLIKERKIALLFLMAVFMGAGIIIHERAWYFAALPMVCGLAWYYEKAKPNIQRLLIISTVIFFAFNIQQLIGLLVNCYA